MSTYRTPDVYIKEVSLFPPSVAEVATAIPAFVGYTARAERNGAPLTDRPWRVKNLLEYEQYFGGAVPPSTVTVDFDEAGAVTGTTLTPRHNLYESVRLFFDNGGGPCWVVSVGTAGSGVDKAALVRGLDAVAKEDEPTLLVVPEAVLLSDTDLAEVQQKMLAQAERLQDRFALLDVKQGAGTTPSQDAATFRNGVGMKGLRYGAAYYPYVRTTLPFHVRYSQMQFRRGGGPTTLLQLTGSSGPAREAVTRLESLAADVAALRQALANAEGSGRTYPAHFQNVSATDRDTKAELVHYATVMRLLALRLRGLGAATGATLKSEGLKAEAKTAADPGGPLEQLVRTLKRFDLAFDYDGTGPLTALGVVQDADFTGYTLPASASDEDRALYGVAATPEAQAVQAARGAFRSLFSSMLALLTGLLETGERALDDAEAQVRSTNPAFQRALEALQRELQVLPPSGAVAGVCAYVDATRGVWKAPANVSLASVVEPVVRLDAQDQESFNVDPDAGKSINVLRAFHGKGTLVWGARTLAGNDNEWRYVSVRRFFNTAEESIKKSTAWAVFEPNDPNTWVKVKSMIENYLTQRWRDGALVGAKPDDAFYVKCALGVTMSPQDVLEGVMNVEIGMAVVRPAEFIVLKFSHKLQTA